MIRLAPAVLLGKGAQDRAFECHKCGQLLHFDSTRCEHCKDVPGYLPDSPGLTALVARLALAAPVLIVPEATPGFEATLAAASLPLVVVNPDRSATSPVQAQSERDDRAKPMRVTRGSSRQLSP